MDRLETLRNRLETLRKRVQRIKAADTKELKRLYEYLIGYDPFEEGETAESVRATLLDYVKEECYSMGVHVSEVGL